MLASLQLFSEVDEKRSEAKPYYIYMTTIANKFLYVHYVRMKGIIFTKEEAVSRPTQ